MEFPKEIVDQINAYAKPATRANWRTLHKYTQAQFRADLVQAYTKTFVRDYGYYYVNERYVIRPAQYRLFQRLIE